MSKFLLIFFVVILLFSVFRRYIFMYLMNAVTRRLFEQAQKQQRGFQNQQMRDEGSVKVDSKPKPGKRLRDDGEYVDYEDVKD
jgi:hypothetical protein